MNASQLRPKISGWRHGRRWKVYLRVGDWFVFDVGLGSVWLWCGRLSITAYRARGAWNEEQDKRAGLTIEWRLRCRAAGGVRG